MKKLLIIGLLLVGCSKERTLETTITAKDGLNGSSGRDGTSCSVFDYIVDDVKLGAKIFCTDGSYSFILNGVNGESIIGPQGESGKDGQSCTVEKVNTTTTVTCGDFQSQIEDGQSIVGPAGPPGENGQNGNSCIQTGYTTQTISYEDYTSLPKWSSAYCKKGSSTHTTTAGNCDQWNCNSNSGTCTTDWKYNPAAITSQGEYTTRVLTVKIPSFTCGE